MRLLGYVPVDELARLYRGAAAFAYPSQFEGFGLPVVEALACGVPTVVSSHPSLDEACGDVALRADPDEPEAFADALEQALAGPAASRERGLVHAARFTWRALGEAVLAGYERALRDSSDDRRLRVGLDVSPLALTRAGAARYIESLLAALPADAVDVRRYGSAAPDGLSSRFMTSAGTSLRCRCAPVRRSRRPPLPDTSRAGEVTVPLVVTLHDIAVLRRPGAVQPLDGRVLPGRAPRVVRAARRVIAASEFTRRELLSLLDLPEEKMRVIPHAVGAPFVAGGDAAFGDYVLTVGTLEPRKNLDRLVDGFERAGLNGSRPPCRRDARLGRRRRVGRPRAIR